MCICVFIYLQLILFYLQKFHIFYEVKSIIFPFVFSPFAITLRRAFPTQDFISILFNHIFFF